ncbi:DUF4064 domain-containing protein [Brochothrix thermosphacta]|uniref:DUF4064 domain-containing protein n=1 Tax=Brochothrix thermosphacta TaxID=2756 RepID=UPI00083F8E63|nr:DUF4064 domain-containing protein [Brochothrix thermosphacta]ODJ60066.1 hypothetical protein BFR44_03215 [Brochothrix thermosphacta]
MKRKASITMVLIAAIVNVFVGLITFFSAYLLYSQTNITELQQSLVGYGYPEQTDAENLLNQLILMVVLWGFYHIILATLGFIANSQLRIVEKPARAWGITLIIMGIFEIFSLQGILNLIAGIKSKNT